MMMIKLWNMVAVILIVIVALGTITKSSVKRLKDLEIIRQAETGPVDWVC